MRASNRARINMVSESTSSTGANIPPELIPPAGIEMQLWLTSGGAASDNYILDANGRIQQWNDLSGKGNHAIQTTAAARPYNQLNSFGTGQNAVYFNGSNWMMCPSVTVKAFTNFLVLTCTQTNLGLILELSPNAGTGYNGFFLTSNTPAIGFFNTGGADQRSAASTWLSSYKARPSTIIHRASGAAGVHHLIRDASGISTSILGGSQAPGTNPITQPLYIGIRGQNLSYTTKMQLAEVIIYDGYITTEATRIRNYLALKWGTN